MTCPCVSVIVPNYNHAVYLRQRIDSVLKQSFKDFEIILLDDCSTDYSRDILSEYKDNPKVSHIIFNEQNSGSTFKQWDKGLALARGKYIWIAESDDFAEPCFLDLAIGEFQKNEKAVLVFTGSHMVNEHGQNIEKDWDHFLFRQSLITVYDGDEFIKDRMILNNSIYNASMVVFRKECYKSVPDTYKQLRYCGDWLFWAEICRQGDVVSINRKLNYFRQHLSKVSVKALDEGLDFMEGCIVIQHLVDELQLSTYRSLVISGRIQKRLLNKKSSQKYFRKQVLHTYRRLFVGGKWAILVYEYDKLLKLLCK